MLCVTGSGIPLDQIVQLVCALRDHLLACAPTATEATGSGASAAASGALSQTGRPISAANKATADKKGGKARTKRRKGKGKGQAVADGNDSDGTADQVQI